MNYESTSKFLSLILRHKPEAIGITLVMLLNSRVNMLRTRHTECIIVSKE